MDQFDRRRLEALLQTTRAFIEARREFTKQCLPPDPLPADAGRLQTTRHRQQERRQTPVGRMHFEFDLLNKTKGAYRELIEIIEQLTPACEVNGSEIFCNTSEFGKLFKEVSQRVHLSEGARRVFEHLTDSITDIDAMCVCESGLVAQIQMPDVYGWFVPEAEELCSEERALRADIHQRIRKTLEQVAAIAILRDSQVLPRVERLEQVIAGLLM